MLELSLLLVGSAAAISLVDWRRGLALCVVTGLIQDPLRKLVDGQPIYFVVLVGVVFGAAVVGAYFARERLAPKYIAGWSQRLGWPLMVFVVLVLLQAVHSFVRYGSVLMTGIGFLVWLSPVVALGLAYRIAANRGLEWIRRWMIFYCVLATAFLSGIYLEYAEVDWAVLGGLGEGLTIYDVGTILKAHSGFFRSSEIAAWHTATAACFVFLLFVGRRVTATRLVVGAIAVGLLVSLGILTGRRKMLVEVGIFVAAYFALVFWYQRGQVRKALVIMVAGLLALSVLADAMGPDASELVRAPKEYESVEGGQYQFYALRGQSVLEDIPERFMSLGLAPVMWAVESLGWFGSGLGTGSQGTADLVDASRNVGAAEGGLGKIVVELGVPGLLVVLWLAVTIVNHLNRVLRATSRASPVHLQMACGFVAILIAKTSSFAVAAQAYSDMFILLLLGFMMGFLFAMPALIQQALALQSRGSNVGVLSTAGAPVRRASRAA